jgi:DNA invertase Pin-like site-specific DNA recombinase
MSTLQPRLRCAVYTRKSTEEGLEQEFNSLDAQREACVAYIASQVGLGWKLVPDHFDDGGISGGTMERPALQRLLQDIRHRKVDVVVVYKIDRLTRSLTDFAKIVEIFDTQSVSFVSVTQQFNTTTSMGRLTLNVLLSFAQFEREVTVERIRDKIAASKKKGMWMGGVVPLGYKVESRKLVIEPAEAATVRHLFYRYLELRSVRALSEEAITSGLAGKAVNAKDRGKPFGRGNLYHLLSNLIYVGKIRHRDNVYDGEHEPILDRDTYDRVQVLLATQAPARRSEANTGGQHLLTGLVFDEAGDRLRSVHTNKKGQRYRYYVSKAFSEERRNDRVEWRLPANELESTVEAALLHRLGNAAGLTDLVSDLINVNALGSTIDRTVELASNWHRQTSDEKRSILSMVISRVDLQRATLTIRISRSALANWIGRGQSVAAPDPFEDVASIACPMSLRRRGVETRMVVTDGSSPVRSPDANLVDVLARAHAHLDDLTSGRCSSLSEVGRANGMPLSEISRTLPLAFLAPRIIETILAGRQPIELTAQRLSRVSELPTSWAEQLKLLSD